MWLKQVHSFKKDSEKKENFKVSATLHEHEIDPQPKQLYASLS